MKTRIRKLFALLLCLVMVVGMFPTAYAEEEGGEIILEDEHDHEHDHEGEGEGTIAPVEAEPEEGSDEETDDPAEEPTGDDTNIDPETEDASDEDETGGLVRVEFICEPADAIITVYDPAQLDENGEQLVIDPEEDGTWLLAPGEYLYDAECEGYFPVRCELPVEKYPPLIGIRVELVDNETIFPVETADLSASNAQIQGLSSSQIVQQIKSTYSSALSKSGRSSFNGYCGAYVNWQLVVLGINSYYVGADGNAEFDTYKNATQTSGGYPVNAYPASSYSLKSALNAITLNGSVDAYNILVGFEQGSGEAGRLYGHTCFIHAIINGTVYFSESYSGTICGGYHAEGDPITCSIDAFCNYYGSWTVLDGVIHFGTTTPTYYLDLNGFLDGQSVGNISEYGTADVYINGKLDMSGVTDYYKQWPTGTTYEIKNIKATSGHKYNGVYSGSLSGTIGSDTEIVVLSFSTAYSVTYKNKSGDSTMNVSKGEYTVAAAYDKLGNSYFIGWSYSPNATMFDVRPGEKIDVTGDVTLYPVYISHAEATSGQPVLIYDISDFPAEGYNITQTTKDVSVTTTESDWGAWSDWSTTAVSSSDTVQVESRTAYGWYYFECPNCHAHMHGYGTCWTWCGGCGATTTVSGWHQMYDPTNWSGAKDWYGTGKYYATINGETWFKWDDGGTQTQYRSRKLVTNTTTTTKTYTAYVIRPAVGYTVSFDANGGTGAPAAQSKYQGQTLILSSTRPTRSCHVFLGWATSASATTAQYQPGGNFTTDANTVLYAVWAEGTQSEWSTTKPSGVDDSLIETKTQYRYADKETTTSDQSTLSGWTLYDTKSSWSDWGSWSDWDTDKYTADDSTQVESRTAYGWYYFECPNCHAHMHGYGTCWTWCGGCGATTTVSGWHQMYDPTNWSGAKDWYGTGKYYATINGETWFKWEDGGSRTEYRYRTRTLNYTYYYYRWKDWSDWGDTVYTANDDRQVETRTLYRYVQSGDVHQWDNGKVTKAATCTGTGVMTYTCTKCGKTRTTEIAAIGHSWGTPSYTWSSDYKTVVASRTCSHNSAHVDTETVNTVPTVSTQPTCTALGKTTYTATFSNSAFAKQTKTVENIAALGHSWGEWMVTTPATVDKDGVETRTCSRCGATETRSYAADTVTVTYNANGGSVSPTSIKILKGGNISNLPTPTRTGYTFNGWFTAASGGTKVTTSTTFSADTTIYAQWTIITYTIKFDANGGTGAPDSQTKTHDVALTLSTTQPTRADASAGSYTVTLNANGGSVSTDKLMAARTTSYTFKNWNTAANGSGASYAPGASYTANAAATLYAQWNSSTSTAAVTLPTPTRTGYSFKGWASSSAATSGTTGSYTPTGDVTLYAIWEADADRPTFRVSEVKSTAGKQVEIPIKLENNPGLFALTVSFSYDTSVLTLVSVTPNTDAFPGTWQTGSLKGATWASNAGDITANDTILTLTFEIAEGAEDGEYNVEIILGEIINEAMEDIDFAATPGKVIVTSHIPGDVNGDGKVSTKDFVALMKYLAGEDVYVVEDALDVNGDGKVSTKDFVILMKYLAGEDVTIY